MAGQFGKYRNQDGLAREIVRLTPIVESTLIRRGIPREDAEDCVSKAAIYLSTVGCDHADILPLLTQKSIWLATNLWRKKTVSTVAMTDTMAVPAFDLSEPDLTFRLWRGGLRELPLAVADLLSDGVNRYQSRLILRYGWSREIKIFREIGEVLNGIHQA